MAELDPWRSPTPGPASQEPAPPAGDGPPPPWLAEAGWQVRRREGNPSAVLARALGVASVVPGVGLGAVVAGVLGLVRARRSGGRGRTASVVGLVLGAASLAVWAAVALGSTAGALLGPGGALAGGSAAAGDGASLSAAEHTYLDHLSEVTYRNFGDDDLVAMGDLACRDLRSGTSADDDAARLSDRYGAGGGDAWDVQRAATQTLCPDAAGALADEPDAEGPTT